ncbi:MAG: ATP-binding protein [Desulfobulbaceae bacterium]|nr:ATP-binding protein [Desulfobulbaceae bacterium]HIJ89724.1 DUF3365 domain-containing protein [Deltaproteobacteria bacterium]
MSRPVLRQKLRFYSLVFVILWTILLAISCVSELLAQKRKVAELAKIEARSIIARDMLYRRWATMHGGVYAPVTEKSQPNPYLAQIPERDLTTPSGRALTLINPSYMTRQVYEMGREYGINGHITSLKLLNPGNAADPWERQALIRIAAGETEVTGLETLDGEPYLRFMRRLEVEKDCLECHAAQGYSEGDVRGGLSASIPMAPYLQHFQERQRKTVLIHFVFWLIGGLGFGMGVWRLHIQAKEQEKVERELRNAALEWSAAMDSSDDATYLLDCQRRIVRANQAFYRLSGSSPQEVVGRHIVEVVHPQGELIPCPVCRAQDELRDLKIIMEAEHPDNPAGRPIEVTVKIVRDSGGEPLSILMSLHDLTDARKEEEERCRLEARLRQSQKMEAIGTLAGGIAHDFNNILSVIFGYTELAIIEDGDPEKRREDLKEVLEGARRAKDLVQQILAFSRKTEQRKQPLQISLIVKDALKMLRSSIPATIEIKQNITSEGTILADSSQIHQVVMNLCVNAYHAMRETGGTLAVSLEEVEISGEDEGYGALIPGRHLKLEVSDSGCGMSPEIREKIFEPYFTTKKTGEGTGLGLAVVHGIVKSHNGHITVYSEPGTGTTFHIYLPLVEEQAAGLPVKEVVADLSGKGEHILFVDDEPQIRDFVEMLFLRYGYRITTFTNGMQALEEFQDHPGQFDLVITDMTMPYMTGAELAQKMLGIRPDIPIILCTGQSELINREKALAMGVCDYLNKPVLQYDFLSAVRKALAKDNSKHPAG